jgi:hypothetical protein
MWIVPKPVPKPIDPKEYHEVDLKAAPLGGFIEQDRQTSLSLTGMCAMNQQKVLQDPVGQQFRQLAAAWKAAETVSSSLTERFAHPAYQHIIAMGDAAVPHLLAELEREPDWWFAALKSITGADPVDPSDRWRLTEMTKAWLQWGRAQGTTVPE